MREKVVRGGKVGEKEGEREWMGEVFIVSASGKKILYKISSKNLLIRL